MLIAVYGPTCSGKTSIVNYFRQRYGFTLLRIQVNGDSTSEIYPVNTNDECSSTITFSSAQSLMGFVLPRWQENWITRDIDNASTAKIFRLRPFTLFLRVHAPLYTRWQRKVRRSYDATRDQSEPSSQCSNFITDLQRFEEFCLNDERESQNLLEIDYDYSYQGPHQDTLEASIFVGHAHTSLILHINNYVYNRNQNGSVTNECNETLNQLYAKLSSVDLVKRGELLIRPSWHAYFMHLARLAARRSNCMKRRVGAVLVHEYRVLSTGYNGTPRGMINCNAGGCGRCNKGEHQNPSSPGNRESLPTCGSDLESCLCVHAEENVLLEAGRLRIPPGATLYCDTCPCLTCSVKIVQMRIGLVVYGDPYRLDEATKKILHSASVKLLHFQPDDVTSHV